MPLSHSQIESLFGRFGYQPDPARRGQVRIEEAWTRGNRGEAKSPWPLATYGGTTQRIRCHRRIKNQLEGALKWLADAGLERLVEFYGGCWVPRHKLWDPRRSLSAHAWGIAVDLNPQTHPFGSNRAQDERLVEAFRRYGFEWGGRWHTPDPMHFEAVEVLGDGSTSLTMNGEPALVVIGDTEIGGRLEEGQVWAPVRPIAEALGATVVWDSQRHLVEVRPGADKP